MSIPPDVLIDGDRDLFWKKAGEGGILYSGPVVVHRGREAFPRVEVCTLIGVVPDQSSTLWVFSWLDFDKNTTKDHETSLPLRFRGQVYEEGMSRAKSYLVDRLMPDVPPERRTDLAWGGHERTGRWTLTVDGREWTFGSAESERGHTSADFDDEMDALQALAAAVKAVIKETRGF